MAHFIEQCRHGKVYSQCRCPSPSKSIKRVSCELAGCKVKERIPDSEIKRIAEDIILSHADDIEYLSITEMTSDMLAEVGWLSDSTDEEEAIWHRVDDMIGKAKITVTFED